MYLADLGAEVIKVEDPGSGGDVSRYIPPGQQGTDSLFFEAFNRNKRSVALDLKNPAGREVFERLVATADAVFSNLRGDQPERLRIRYQDLAAVNPRIVCVALTGYGSAPDQALLPGYDALVQAESGWASLTGDPDGPPTKSGLSLADYICGLTAMVGLLAGLRDARAHRCRPGRGHQPVRQRPRDAVLPGDLVPVVGLRDASPAAVGTSVRGAVPVLRDRRWPHRDRLSQGEVLRGAGRASWACRSWPRTSGSPRSRRAASTATRCSTGCRQRFAELTTAEWLDLLRGVVPIAPVRSLSQALDVDELQERGHARGVRGRDVRAGAVGRVCRCTSRASRPSIGRARAWAPTWTPSSRTWATHGRQSSGCEPRVPSAVHPGAPGGDPAAV